MNVWTNGRDGFGVALWPTTEDATSTGLDGAFICNAYRIQSIFPSAMDYRFRLNGLFVRCSIDAIWFLGPTFNCSIYILVLCALSVVPYTSQSCHTNRHTICALQNNYRLLSCTLLNGYVANASVNWKLALFFGIVCSQSQNDRPETS